MRLRIFLFSLLSLLLLAVGCGGGETDTAVPDQPGNAVENNTDTQTVAAKPQLIEFYASW